MRKVEDNQMKGTSLFDGDDATSLWEARKGYEEQAAAACTEFHAAIDTVEARFQELGKAYEQQLVGLFSQLGIEGKPSDYAFNYSLYEEHGIIFAQKVTAPTTSITDIMRAIFTGDKLSLGEMGVIVLGEPSYDGLVATPVGESVDQRWNKGARAPEHA